MNSKAGKRAQVRYRGGITGEKPIDDMSNGEPVTLVLGVGEIIPGLDHAFMEMEIGEERTVVIPPEDGYGEHDPDGVQTYIRTFSPAFETAQVGDFVFWTNPASGMKIPVRVVKADEQLVTLDFNHPFAGNELTYWVQLVGLE